MDLYAVASRATPIIIHATVAGSTLTMAIPQVVLGKAHGFAGITAVLVSLTWRIPPLGHGHDALILAGNGPDTSSSSPPFISAATAAASPCARLAVHRGRLRASHRLPC